MCPWRFHSLPGFCFPFVRIRDHSAAYSNFNHLSDDCQSCQVQGSGFTRRSIIACAASLNTGHYLNKDPKIKLKIVSDLKVQPIVFADIAESGQIAGFIENNSSCKFDRIGEIIFGGKPLKSAVIPDEIECLRQNG